MPESAIQWLLTLLAALVGYELVRWAILRNIKRRLKAGALSFVLRGDGAKIMSYCANSIVHYFEAPATS